MRTQQVTILKLSVLFRLKGDQGLEFRCRREASLRFIDSRSRLMAFPDSVFDDGEPSSPVTITKALRDFHAAPVDACIKGPSP